MRRFSDQNQGLLLQQKMNENDKDSQQGSIKSKDFLYSSLNNALGLKG